MMHVKHQADRERERMRRQKEEFASHVAAKKVEQLKKAAILVRKQNPQTIALLTAFLSGKTPRPAL
ncbi:Uncharacterised protein [Candidatus Norongarragalina meridionalis]|nr:Uncharacterised protein [Candidatus Norongarragalina meridionalis]